MKRLHALEYVAIILYALAVVRSLSFGIYGIKHGNNALFAVVLTLTVASAALFYMYIRVTST
ncbi:MAG: hypothetical protein J1F63_00175 [Oscillospiraceae bacterium]|nr:hypothetical protein [Oscillospiraceae bacterium]